MTRYLLSNWITVVGTVVGFYVAMLALAILNLFRSDRGLTFETVVVETLGGSLMYAFGMLWAKALIFLAYLTVLIVLDAVLFSMVNRLVYRLALGAVIMVSIFVAYLIVEDAPALWPLPIAFLLTQWWRYRKLLPPTSADVSGSDR